MGVRMRGRKGGRVGVRVGGREGGRERGRDNPTEVKPKILLWCVLLMSERGHTLNTHVHLTLSNTVHEVDAARGNDHFARYPSEVRGGHPCHWTPAGSKTIPWRNINSY